MIRIVTKYDYENNITSIKLRHKHSCTMEFLALIERLMQEIETHSDTTRKEIYKYLKEIEKENEEIEVI